METNEDRYAQMNSSQLMTSCENACRALRAVYVELREQARHPSQQRMWTDALTRLNRDFYEMDSTHLSRRGFIEKAKAWEGERRRLSAAMRNGETPRPEL
ncbi:MAG: hypothetical protein LBE83_00300 [Propionibacteriaceae bacterium]|jgi:hypothetical protein|nr:hypothetical protein [Propionibacteriaceae bacterium]